ncbi:hypothetical protein QBC32DRAFT_347727 [Pseudoneurospora amorphoporcata]|uniref:BTB domain-containing protein n=1 Tax=Pseudoneurospora amorphoporcata TaxID=241081 RepID=A0AAN6NS54_9PEZI|nr:hypothetical protein QBC32DRAFT_347727 [Pseudoneurospora amorphoporcata]
MEGKDPHGDGTATRRATTTAPTERFQPLEISFSSLPKASTVFKTMLSPPWIKSQGISAENPKEINLPEDNPEGMEILCLALHFSNDRINTCPPGSLIFDAAILIDK